MRLRAATLPVALALAVAACGGQTTDNEPPAPPRGPCPASHDLVGGRCVMREIYFPGGTFTMGRGYCPEANALATPPSYQCPLADAPHQVTVKGFYVDATVFSYTPDSGGGPESVDDTCAPDSVCQKAVVGPVGQDTLHDLEVNYCKSRGMRLLTEAEWEYIATGGGKRTYPWGDQEPTCARADIDPQCKPRWAVPGHPHIPQVASYPPTPEGVYDLAGDAVELVAPSPEAYTDGYTALPAHSPPCTGATGACCGSAPNAWCNFEELFPARGGSSDGLRNHLRSAYRTVAISSPGYGKYASLPGDVGYTFRCARDAQ